VSEGLHETAAEDVARLIQALAGEISPLWGPLRQQAILTSENPKLEIHSR
jgi:hypothetical protein